MPTVGASTMVKVGKRRLNLSNLEKPLYPSGFTKGEVAEYYIRIAPVMLPYLKGRAITLKRYPNGATAPFTQSDWKRWWSATRWSWRPAMRFRRMGGW